MGDDIDRHTVREVTMDPDHACFFFWKFEKQNLKAFSVFECVLFRIQPHNFENLEILIVSNSSLEFYLSKRGPQHFENLKCCFHLLAVLDFTA